MILEISSGVLSVGPTVHKSSDFIYLSEWIEIGSCFQIPGTHVIIYLIQSFISMTDSFYPPRQDIPKASAADIFYT